MDYERKNAGREAVRRRRRRLRRRRAAFRALGVVVCAAAGALTVCGCLYISGHLSAAGGSVSAAEDVPEPPVTGPEAEDPAPPEIPDAQLPPEAPETGREAEVEPYEFGTPVEENGTVEDEWFDGAVFLGDSRTEGLQLYSGLAHGDFFWSRGMSVFRADDEDYRLFDVGGEKVTLLGTLRAGSYDAVYIMLGINELGYPVESYRRALEELVDKVLELQPEAVVYLQTMMPVNDRKARESGIASYENNENVKSFNEVIADVARDKRVALLDMSQVYSDSEGQLPEDLTVDGVHFTAGGYAMWADHLRSHTLDPERYFLGRKS